MELYTIAMYNWRKARDLGIDILDTTAKGGISNLAPTWGIVKAYKQSDMGTQAEITYTTAYYEQMRESYKEHKDEWMEIFSKEKIAVACYCPPGKFCHRKLLIDMLTAIAKSLGVEVTFKGEIT